MYTAEVLVQGITQSQDVSRAPLCSYESDPEQSPHFSELLHHSTPSHMPGP